MKIETSINFDFVNVKNSYKRSLKKFTEKNIDDVVEQVRDNLKTGKHNKNNYIEDSTRRIRLERKRTGQKSLVDTGNLMKSIKKTKTGISMKGYGVLQDEGFTIKAGHSFAVPNKRAKVKQMYHFKSDKKVPSRKFIVYEPRARAIDNLFNVIVKNLRTPMRLIKTMGVKI